MNIPQKIRQAFTEKILDAEHLSIDAKSHALKGMQTLGFYLTPDIMEQDEICFTVIECENLLQEKHGKA